MQRGIEEEKLNRRPERNPQKEGGAVKGAAGGHATRRIFLLLRLQLGNECSPVKPERERPRFSPRNVLHT